MSSGGWTLGSSSNSLINTTLSNTIGSTYQYQTDNSLGTPLGQYGGFTTDGTYYGITTQPNTSPSPQYIPIVVSPTDKLKSTPKHDEGIHDHVIECRFNVESTKVTAEYFCSHCNEVLHSKVISKLPKSIMNKKCLPRLVKGV